MRAGARLDDAVREYFAQGGTIAKIPEGKITIDWTTGGALRHVARLMSKRGHKKRHRKTKKAAQ